MTEQAERWTLGAKLAVTSLPFLVVGLLLTGLTLWVSWQLDGGAAAVNEAGRLRMQAYRLAWVSSSTAVGDPDEGRLRAEFDASFRLLELGDPDRPLFVPWDDAVRSEFLRVQASWRVLRALDDPQRERPPRAQVDRATIELVARIDRLVGAIESHLARYTAIMHLLQVGLLLVGLAAAAVLVVVGWRFVLEPVGDLKQAVAALRGGDLSVRVPPRTSDELGALAVGFNDMAERLQASYADLEGRVRLKTAELEDQRTRLQALYDISVQVAEAVDLDDMAQGFVRRVREVARADAAALRWADVAQQQFVLLAGDGLPQALAEAEHCIPADDCFCGQMGSSPDARVIPIHAAPPPRRLLCERAGWAAVAAVPIRAQDRLLGELNLFFHAETSLSGPDRALLETTCSHLASGMENLRLRALEREAAVAEERGFLARELHDSIAQSLAFLNIQAQLMRKAMARDDRQRMSDALAEIELGLQESHGDVRELLLHFRTRTNSEDIVPALQATLNKFERQSGVAATLAVHGQGLPLPPDVQVQALHIVQEALSNVRKHARATRVQVEVWKQPEWRFAVHDDGVGFVPPPVSPEGAPDASAHVGLRIMRERAERLGAQLQLQSVPGQGSTLTLTLPPLARAPAAPPTLPPQSPPQAAPDAPARTQA
ncbi:MAG: type IV pili methyl-accepting chemotaxis transducer N-terminal domain-containing protein [Burkholderiaceae bacterium]|nr:type IV pili methyl-accepting chemotaxis transducer N-terminal domain-containing protein [Burkholderiaceae bacterium]